LAHVMPAGRILVVDDDPVVLMVFCELLQRLGEGNEIVAAPDGHRALEEVEAAPFDLVITDLRMPGLGGVELTEAIRNSSPNTAVVWITAHGCQDVLRDAARLEICGCYDKPVDVSVILQVARDALANRPCPHDG
jgi:CheY-like chemotaxis protein